MRFVPEGTEEEVIGVGVSKESKTNSSAVEENERSMSNNMDPDSSGVRTIAPAAVMTSARMRKVTKQMTHYLFGHMSVRDAVAAAKHIGTYDVLPGGVVMCEPCMVGKSRRANLNRKGGHIKSETPNGRI